MVEGYISFNNKFGELIQIPMYSGSNAVAVRCGVEKALEQNGVQVKGYRSRGQDYFIYTRRNENA